MASNSNLCIRTESDPIDITLGGLKVFFPVTSNYRSRQKSNSGRLIPFEAIDNKIYKENSNCTCFLTSEKRVHAWIKALAEVLFMELGSKSEHDVVWRDQKEKEAIAHTEFIVNESDSGKQTSDNVTFKVIVYLTTGKVMIQGKGYESFGSKFFQKCVDLVNEYMKKSVEDKEHDDIDKTTRKHGETNFVHESFFDDTLDAEETTP